jgi:hypothetical protein
VATVATVVDVVGEGAITVVESRRGCDVDVDSTGGMLGAVVDCGGATGGTVAAVVASGGIVVLVVVATSARISGRASGAP